jgi:electron transfer flavoprotein alpha subunit
MRNIILINIYSIILNNMVKNELKKYFGKGEIKRIIIKTKDGYKNLMEQMGHHKYAFENICINTYFISLYTNIGKEISRDAYKKMHEDIIKNCKTLTAKRKTVDYFRKIFKRQSINNIIKA